MNRMHALAAVAALALAVAAPATAQLAVRSTGSKTVTLTDRVGKNQFTWTSDAPLEKIKGTAEGVSGSFTIDPKNVAGLRGTISAQVATMKTGSGTRDEHLRGAQWLDAARHPQISFTISSVSNVKVTGNKATATATGTFSMHGVTKQMSIPFTITWLDESAATQKRAPGDLVMVEASFSVALKDFRVAGSQGLIGSKVGETIAITAKLFGSTK
ncbi:MAG TPA: YceI family protein [Candidatus Kapabacteria bacterium]|nr:YceI family protein [Candidatus Kapabacteria bacterium]